MTSGTENQLPPAEIHPFLEARTTPIATTASTAVAINVSLSNRLSHDRFIRGSARWIRSLARASEDCVSAEDVTMRHLNIWKNFQNHHTRSNRPDNDPAV